MNLNSKFFKKINLEPKQISIINPNECKCGCKDCKNCTTYNKNSKYTYPKITIENCMDIIKILINNSYIMQIQTVFQYTRITLHPLDIESLGCDEAYFRIEEEDISFKNAILKTILNPNIENKVLHQIKELFKE